MQNGERGPRSVAGGSVRLDLVPRPVDRPSSASSMDPFLVRPGDSFVRQEVPSIWVLGTGLALIWPRTAHIAPVPSGAQRWRYEGTTPGTHGHGHFSSALGRAGTIGAGLILLLVGRRRRPIAATAAELQRQVPRPPVLARAASPGSRAAATTLTFSVHYTDGAGCAPTSIEVVIAGVGQFAMSGPGSGFEERRHVRRLADTAAAARGITASPRRAAAARARETVSDVQTSPNRVVITAADATPAATDAQAARRRRRPRRLRPRRRPTSPRRRRRRRRRDDPRRRPPPGAPPPPTAPPPARRRQSPPRCRPTRAAVRQPALRRRLRPPDPAASAHRLGARGFGVGPALAGGGAGGGLTAQQVARRPSPRRAGDPRLALVAAPRFATWNGRRWG